MKCQIVLKFLMVIFIFLLYHSFVSAINVSLNTPANGSWYALRNVNFSYTVVSAVGIKNCSLDVYWNNGTLISKTWNTSVIQNNTAYYENYTVPLDGYTYLWNVTCYDINNNPATSETWQVKVGCGELYDNEIKILNNNITTSSSCIIVRGNNVIVDCQGYWINGTNQINTTGIFIGGNNVTIRNCKLGNWGSRSLYPNKDCYNDLGGKEINFENSSSVYIGGNNVRILNSNFFNGFGAIRINGGDYEKINNVTIKDFSYFGIYAYNSRDSNISNSYIEKIRSFNLNDYDRINCSHFGAAVYLSFSPVEVNNNTILDSYIGIIINNGQETITNNQINNTIYSVFIRGDAFSNFYQTINNNLINGKQFIYLADGIHNNLVYDGKTQQIAQIWILNGTNITIKNMDMRNCGTCILIWDSDEPGYDVKDIYIENVTINYSLNDGIFVENKAENVFINNTKIYNTGDIHWTSNAIALILNRNGKISNTKIYDFIDTGIATVGDNITIKNSYIGTPKFSTWVYPSLSIRANNTLIKNITIADTPQGIHIRQGISNITIENSIINNSGQANDMYRLGYGGADFFRTAIVVEPSNNITIRNNKIYCNGDCNAIIGEMAGGIHVYSSDVSIVNNSFYGNPSTNSGKVIKVDTTCYGSSALDCKSTSRIIRDVNITNNYARNWGVTYLEGTSTYYIENLKIDNNVFEDFSGANLRADFTYNTTISNNIFRRGKYGTYLYYGGNNILKNNSFINASIYGNYLYYTTNNLVWDSKISNSANKDIYQIGLASNNNTYLNTTFNKNSVYVQNGEIWVKWYLDVYVKNKANNPISNANVTAKNVYDKVVFSELTNTSGAIARKNLTEYKQNSSGKFFYTNYSVSVSATRYSSKSTEVNLTKSEKITIILDFIPSDGGGGGERNGGGIINNPPKIINYTPTNLTIYITNETTLNFYAKAIDLDGDLITLRFYLDGLEGVVEKSYKGLKTVEGHYSITLNTSHTVIAYVVDNKGGYDQVVWHIFKVSCIDYWQCGDWGNCSEDGYRQRECWKINPECESNANKPATKMFDPECLKVEERMPKINLLPLLLFLSLLIFLIFFLIIVAKRLKKNRHKKRK